jgi:hypothetical protein
MEIVASRAELSLGITPQDEPVHQLNQDSLGRSDDVLGTVVERVPEEWSESTQRVEPPDFRLETE